MAKILWKSGRIFAFLIGVFILYSMARIQIYDYKVSVVLSKVHPNEVWEFVADFSNMKYLNPTILDFKIISESGNYDHWKYSVEYSEQLSHWPYLPNHAVAEFDIEASPKKDVYYIYSTHTTCMFMGFYCLDSESEFKFKHSNKTNGCLCEETVRYRCPTILSTFCRREVSFQRTNIINNMKKKFNE